MYRVFRNIPNSSWNALCEFVDNSIQACLDSNADYPFKIDITITNNSIRIFDNGPGFSENDLNSGLEPARIPKDKNQLNEFGMGMKLAALYFGDRYTIETSNGNGKIHEIKFDLDEVIENELIEIPVIQKTHEGSSFTLLTIDKLSVQTKINVELHLNQIISKLSEVYSVFISDKNFTIRINDIPLTVPEVPILIAPWWKNENGPKMHWIYNFEIIHGDFGISGFVALRDPMNSANRGFKLIRRGRVVDGIQNDVKPHIIFGSPGSHLSKRLIGNIHLHGFGISFNKAEILNNNELETLWGMLKNELNLCEFPILDQGRNYRIGKLKTEESKNNDVLSPPPITNSNPKQQLIIEPSDKLTENFPLQIGAIGFTIQKGTNTGKFIQSENPNVVFRADFFTSETTRNKVIQILQIFISSTNTSLTQPTIIKLIDMLWPHLK